MNGKINVESRVDEGSTFTLTLPAAYYIEEVREIPENRIIEDPEVTKAYSRLEGAGKKILLVEDSEPAVIQMKDILLNKGYIVDVARDGREALQMIEHDMPDGIILDLMMPDVDGFQVLKTLRDEEKTFNLPVLILTAKHITKEELKFLKGNHISQLIQKGDISKDELLASVAKMIFPKNMVEKNKTQKTINLVEGAVPNILVIDDNEDNLNTTKAILEPFCRVFCESDPRKGIETAINNKPDIILLDISMPDVDGFEAAKQLWSVDKLKDVPIIALTAKAMKGDREKIEEFGFDGYVSKPIDAELLHKTIRAFLNGF